MSFLVTKVCEGNYIGMIRLGDENGESQHDYDIVEESSHSCEIAVMGHTHAHIISKCRGILSSNRGASASDSMSFSDALS